MPQGALLLADEAVMVVSDLHLEKGSAYAARGQMTPPYDTRATLDRLARLLERHSPRTVISLGDSFHDGGARARMAPDDVSRVRSLTAACEWIWIEGNHDPAPPADLGGQRMSELEVSGLVLRHTPSAAVVPGEISGHLHPCARVSGRGGTIRNRCFATDGRRLVMPAFGALTGGLNVLDPAFADVFPEGLTACVLGQDSVYPVRPDRLAPDGLRRR